MASTMWNDTHTVWLLQYRYAHLTRNFDIVGSYTFSTCSWLCCLWHSQWRTLTMSITKSLKWLLRCRLQYTPPLDVSLKMTVAVLLLTSNSTTKGFYTTVSLHIRLIYGSSHMIRAFLCRAYLNLYLKFMAFQIFTTVLVCDEISLFRSPWITTILLLGSLSAKSDLLFPSFLHSLYLS